MDSLLVNDNVNLNIWRVHPLRFLGVLVFPLSDLCSIIEGGNGMIEARHFLELIDQCKGRILSASSPNNAQSQPA
jgi:hypothetical protein